MRHTTRAFLAMIFALIVVVAQSAASLAADRDQSARVPLDREACQSWIASLRSVGPTEPSFWAENREAIAGVKDTDCYLLTTDSSSSSALLTALGVPTAAAATSCAQRYRTMGLYIGPIEAATAHHKVWMCWNGTTAYHPSGTYENCWVSTIPVYFGDDEWCGVISNYTALAKPHMDFYVAPYAAPWWHRYGWMEFTVSKTGATSGAYGYCCD